MRYRRADVAGATYFFTVNLADRQASLLVDHIDALREALRRVRQAHPFRIDAMVVLPDHLHALWTLPPGDADFATRWMLIKAGFSRQIPATEFRSPSRVAKGERGIWQRRYWEHVIRDEEDFARHVEYIHSIPSSMGSCGSRWSGPIRRCTGMFGLAWWGLSGRRMAVARGGSVGDGEVLGFAGSPQPTTFSGPGAMAGAMGRRYSPIGAGRVADDGCRDQ